MSSRRLMVHTEMVPSHNPAFTVFLHDLRVLVEKIDRCIIEAKQAGADHLIPPLQESRNAMLALVDRAQEDSSEPAPKLDLRGHKPGSH